MGADWGPVVVAVVMFILLSPGLLFQLPARTRVIEFGNMYTSGIAILVHILLWFTSFLLFLLPPLILIFFIFLSSILHIFLLPLQIVIFIILAPGLIFQLPGKHRPVEFLNMKTTVVSMFLHTVLFGLLLILFLIILNIHIYV
ncbi:hypothetical protein LguiA_016932 [Lonicera macranthoides]